jgi:hypothetical protein
LAINKLPLVITNVLPDDPPFAVHVPVNEPAVVFEPDVIAVVLAVPKKALVMLPTLILAFALTEILVKIPLAP